MIRPVTRLIGVAHGTRDPRGPLVIDEIMSLVSAGLPEVAVQTAYVELNEPSLGDALADLDGQAVVVPLLLSRGFHLRHDVPSVVARSRRDVTIAPGLGPDARLASVLQRRLLEAGVAASTAVVMIAAGSRDPSSLPDLRRAESLLSGRRPGPVRFATLSGCGPTVAEVTADLRALGHESPAASPYLLAPGHFHELARSVARDNGIDTIAEVLGGHDLIAELVIDRYHQGGRHAPVPRPAVAVGSLDHDAHHSVVEAAAS
jgi:sirohydrochlorin ferrochelatase